MPEEERPPSAAEGRTAKRRKSEPSRSDIAAVVPAGQFTGQIRPRETRLEMETRLRIEEANAEHARILQARKAAHEQWRDRVILVGGSIALAVLGIYCLIINALPGQTVEGRSWATSTLTAIVTGVIGYVIGKAAASS